MKDIKLISRTQGSEIPGSVTVRGFFLHRSFINFTFDYKNKGICCFVFQSQSHVANEGIFCNFIYFKIIKASVNEVVFKFPFSSSLESSFVFLK